MIRSMTGFASMSREQGGLKAVVTIKSVNHRFLDVALKASSALAAVESRVRAIVQQRLTRGRVELTLAVEATGDPGRDVVLDLALLERLSAALDRARAQGLVIGSLTASDVIRMPQIVDIRPRVEATPELAEETAAIMEVVVRDALDALVVMRETEGRFLRADLEARLVTLASLVAGIEQQSRDGQVTLETRLRQRLAELPGDLTGDGSALAQEVVRFVARSDIDEEMARLRGHFEHWRGLSDGPEPCGRKLDFLVQEMNREINTAGAKAEGTRATEIVIAAKAELERMREQVQNVE